MDFSQKVSEKGGKALGRVVFELYGDIVPKTAENFRQLACGDVRQRVTERGNPFWYKGSSLHEIKADTLIMGGDFDGLEGAGGQSIYGKFFKDENFVLKHDKPMLLSMANHNRPDTNSSQFFITAKPMPQLDGKHVVFGIVIEGKDVISKVL